MTAPVPDGEPAVAQLTVAEQNAIEIRRAVARLRGLGWSEEKIREFLVSVSGAGRRFGTP
jgi:hypothetical protein